MGTDPRDDNADEDDDCRRHSMSRESSSSVSTTNLVFERIGERLGERLAHPDEFGSLDDADPLKEEEAAGAPGHDPETCLFLPRRGAEGGKPDHDRRERGLGPMPMDRTMRRILLVVCALFTATWLAGLFVYMSSQPYRSPVQNGGSGLVTDPQAETKPGKNNIALNQIMDGYWYPERHSIHWIAGPAGEDGLLLEKGAAGKDYLVVDDVRAKDTTSAAVQGAAPATVASSRTLMKTGLFQYDGKSHTPSATLPSRDLERVLVATDQESNWRHSSTAVYWIFHVASQTAEPLIPSEPAARIQLAQWSPTSDAVVFTRDNNMFLRRVGSNKIVQITTDGGPDVFNGVPDWVYEEEVLAGASATWWSEDGNHIAFLRTNETGVLEYPVEYFISRPSGKDPKPGEESYPEVREIKYPKAGAHNPVVDLKFYDTKKGDVFSVDISGGFADEDRLITTVVWADKQVLIKETNRVSDVMRVVLVDVASRKGKTVRTTQVKAIDGGWFEISQKTRYVPAHASKGRTYDGYIDMVIHDNGDHLAYFVPMDSSNPIMLTSGTTWEVDEGPSAVDLDRNLVYFTATRESSIQRHVYQVGLTSEGLAPVTDVSSEGYYSMSFSTGAGYGLLSYQGPDIPWQKVISTPSNPLKYEVMVEENVALAEKTLRHALPILVYGTVNIDGVELNYVERRPPGFDPTKKYPVLFQQYSGPGSQQVAKQFKVDFQSYVAAGLGYLCVTVDGRGTGFIGRRNRVVVRGELGRWESHDQIAAARAWAAKPYVDADRLAIWGWSFGGFATLKTLEQDAGRTFRYGVAVAPVTDWRFYDSIYTERYMLTPQSNAAGYAASAVTNATALSQNVRFLLMHGVADDNVHMQNSMTLLDRLDLADASNYDVHIFPDSDHGIYFHGANRIVYEKLSNWIINAFNGEWLKINNAVPNRSKRGLSPLF